MLYEVITDGKINVRGVSWHTDHSFQPEPPKATALYAVSLPSKGGDTDWAHMGAAYDALPDTLRTEIDGLEAVHAYTESRIPPSLAERIAAGDDDASDGVVHPLIRRITSYNVCYTKLLRTARSPPRPANQNGSPAPPPAGRECASAKTPTLSSSVSTPFWQITPA